MTAKVRREFWDKYGNRVRQFADGSEHIWDRYQGQWLETESPTPKAPHGIYFDTASGQYKPYRTEEQMATISYESLAALPDDEFHETTERLLKAHQAATAKRERLEAEIRGSLDPLADELSERQLNVIRAAAAEHDRIEQEAQDAEAYRWEYALRAQLANDPASVYRDVARQERAWEGESRTAAVEAAIADFESFVNAGEPE